MDNMYNNVQYPELYNRLYPKVRECVDRYMYIMPVNGMPTQDQMDGMVNEVYDRMVKECPEIDQDPDENRRGASQEASSQQRPFYGRRRLLRDFISIILLRDLLRRRRFPYYGYPGYGYGPGYGYPGYGYPGYGPYGY